MKTRLIIVASCALLAACGGSTSSTGASTTVGSTTSGATGSSTSVGAAPVGQAGAQLTPEQVTAAQAYRQCLRDNGAQIGRGGGQGGQFPQGGQPPTGAAGGQAPTGSTPVVGQAPVGQAGEQPTGDGQPPQDGRNAGPVGSVDPAVLKKAQDTCAPQLPAGLDAATAMTAGRGQGGTGTPGGQPGAGGQARGGFDPTVIAAYISCLKDNGVNVPDAPASTVAPTTVASASSSAPGQRGPGGQGGRGGQLGNIDRTTPEFTAANEKCKVLLPNNGDGFGDGPGGTPGGPPTPPAGVSSTTAVG
jgi:hypothetical protein